MGTSCRDQIDARRPCSSPGLQWLSLAPWALLAAGVLLLAGPAPAQGQDSEAGDAQRIVIEYVEGSFEILSQTYLRKVLPPHDELPREAGSDRRRELSGFWFEVLGDGSVRYRRSIENPIIETFEGIDPENPEAGLSRVESLPERRVFTVLVPYFGPQVEQELSIFSSPLEPGRQHLAAEEVARLPLGIPDGWLTDPIP